MARVHQATEGSWMCYFR